MMIQIKSHRASGVTASRKNSPTPWRLERRFKPDMDAATRERKLEGWAQDVKGVLASDEGE